MCGIAGIYNFNNTVDLDALMNFTNSLTHRGPNGSGFKLLDNENLGLGHRRLSILDLSDLGRQPMSFDSQRLWITYNGEIFNFIEIKNELMAKNHKFYSDSDTEVILAAYLEWGEKCFEKFNGMWALAIWDDNKKQLFLSRDRFGIKPLYYIYIPGQMFAFASETRAFKELYGFHREFDPHLLEYNLNDSYALEGLGYTVFKNILQLLPGHNMVIKKEITPKQKRWWHINDHLSKDIPATYEDQVKVFYELFRDACRIRLISDVPIATALSGGLDSTAVYSTVYDILQKETLGRVNIDSQRAFTAIFPGLDQNEKEYAEKAVIYTGGSITYLDTDIKNLPYKISTETELSDFISTSPITSIATVYEGMRKNGVAISMDGHGVDEMLYGYRDMVYGLYNNTLWNQKKINVKNYSQILSVLYHPVNRNAIKAKIERDLEEKAKREKNLIFNIKKSIYGNIDLTDYYMINLPSLSDKPYDFSKMPIEKRMIYVEFFQHTLPSLLRNFDRASMMNSVEIRMPFMDWRLVTYLFSLPIDSKIGKGFTKRILRDAMKNRMEESLRIRTYKVGISSPIDYWFNSYLKEWILDILDIGHERLELEKAYKNGKVNKQLVRTIWQKINVKLIK